MSENPLFIGDTKPQFFSSSNILLLYQDSKKGSHNNLTIICKTMPRIKTKMVIKSHQHFATTKIIQSKFNSQKNENNDVMRYGLIYAHT